MNRIGVHIIQARLQNGHRVLSNTPHRAYPQTKDGYSPSAAEQRRKSDVNPATYPGTVEDNAFSRIPLQRPIAIPQLGKGRGVPFQRLYAPILAQHGISERGFIDFIDTLNVVSSASPALKVLDLAGGFIGMVPHHWAQIAATSMQAVAKGGIALVSKSRTETFLSESNRSFFAPRNLRVQLVSTEELLTAVRFPKDRNIIASPLQENVPLEQQPSFHTRLLLGLRDCVSDTVATSLPPRTERNLLDKLSADQVSRDIRKVEKKALKESRKEEKKKQNKKQNTEQKLAEKLQWILVDGLST
ncbi:hypothetical protein VTN96DRAFT_6804 [Rasamsonia emersonii]|uniref:Uncharacterized protein n=1 Tax=Rasamsonia emersonii (strain ATCC 16479 / CBS 393.64 / IMI 116815) TaxID=1408163 RepID=A0A0F4YXX0_RASE3|nr:hypothetical protein T310_3285 [Rasamsonia emersonii CBS 393.64]KKA22666.1 hypothetical protein T310_3285 [Rasamsonia emersonii CBS 393.64]